MIAYNIVWWAGPKPPLTINCENNYVDLFPKYCLENENP